MKRSEHRFVVHVWREIAVDGEGQWRGSVDHIGHERRLYFSSLVDLIDFIRERRQAQGLDPADPAKT